MAHKTLISGTAYEISGGKTLVNGTAYEIKNGKTLVGGTAYEVGFGATVTITGEGNFQYGEPVSVVTIDGVDYTAATTLVVPIGTVVTCSVASYARSHENGYVKVNGTTVMSLNRGEEGAYDYVVNGNVNITMSWKRDAVGDGGDPSGYIEITEQ